MKKNRIKALFLCVLLAAGLVIMQSMVYAPEVYKDCQDLDGAECPNDGDCSGKSADWTWCDIKCYYEKADGSVGTHHIACTMPQM